MAGALTPGDLSPKLREVAERAKRDPKARFHALAYLIDEAALVRSYGRLRRDAAIGVDGVSVGDYGSDLQANLAGLYRRMKARQYRHQPIRRVNIPKDKGGTRPLGISTTEDKVVQGALREVLEAVYEQDFLGCSYGWRPGRSAHDAIRELNAACVSGRVNWLLEADIVGFFDHLVWEWLQKMLQHRIPDGSIKRLVGKCLRAGVLEGGVETEPERGSPQGSIISPLLGNVYLHYVLDLWFERVVRPRLRGHAQLIRYCDDFVMVFDSERDARSVQAALHKRMGKFGLALHPEKTRLFQFGRPPRSQRSGKGPGTFDFLGFTFYWRRSRTGTWMPAIKTRSARLSRAILRVSAWCRDHRHLPIVDQHRGLLRLLNGHLNYFAVNGNTKRIGSLIFHATRAWIKWLKRRGQKRPITWKRFKALLQDYPLPKPRVRVQIWGT